MAQYENIATKSDYDALSKAYKFIPEVTEKSAKSSTWQDRMAEHYHSHLYKSYVLADFTYFKQSKVGFRWRTKREVLEGKGHDTCGNKHCPSYYDSSQNKKAVTEVTRWSKNVKNRSALARYTVSKLRKNLDSLESSTESDEKSEESNLLTLPFGIGLHNYQVHFAYVEHSEKKEELVKLKLCLRCAPMLFHRKGGVLGALFARMKETERGHNEGGRHHSHNEDLSKTEDLWEKKMREKSDDDSDGREISIEDERSFSLPSKRKKNKRKESISRRERRKKKKVAQRSPPKIENGDKTESNRSILEEKESTIPSSSSFDIPNPRR